jgi:hypothetical protein
MVEQSFANRRKEVRHPQQLPLRIQGQDSKGQIFVEVVLTQNISLSGACLLLNKEIKIGQELQIFSCNGLIPHQATAKVCWVKRENDFWMVGLHFERSTKIWKNMGVIFNQLLLNQNLLLPV